MTKSTVEVCNNKDMQSLEQLLSSVERPGSFFVQGMKEIPMPKIEVENVGILSFPIPEEQIKKLIEQAALAPYGRGEETVFDISVRKTWQIAPEKITISGTSWKSHFDAILQKVKEGLGCQDVTVTVELYKLLIYDKGAFFLKHRDSEKTDGMFGTLVVVLPCRHAGGELIISHAGVEVSVDLHNIDVSTLNFAAFYADCEHEVQPITDGNRVCLVHNLIQKGAYRFQLQYIRVKP